MQKIKLYNTLTRSKEIFKPLKKTAVGLYTCGPTVYNYAHIGNLRTYIFEDVLRRALVVAGYRVRHVMNITDVGHLTSDADIGEDKLEKGAAREGKSVWDIARFYTDAFLADIAALNIRRADKLVPATATIKDQIALIKKLFAKGYAYETKQAVYFEVSRFPNYTRLSRQKLEDKKTAARADVVEDPEKRNPADFALWFKRVGKFSNHTMHWSSPWGEGFPGWHIECSAISTKYLGQPFDIHTGGVDHIATHHTNEIAQSEGAIGKPLARWWMHGEFLLVQEEKMAKSGGNFYTLQSLVEYRSDPGLILHKSNPLAFRYLCLTAHYRSKINFTRESLMAADHSLARFYLFIKILKYAEGEEYTRRRPKSKMEERMWNKELEGYRQLFLDAIFDDLNTPKALAVVWKIIHAYYKDQTRYHRKTLLNLLFDFDKILGLGLEEKVNREIIPVDIATRIVEREKARKEKNWQKADAIRNLIQAAGYELEDTPSGAKLRKT